MPELNMHGLMILIAQGGLQVITKFAKRKARRELVVFLVILLVSVEKIVIDFRWQVVDLKIN